jgi:glycosyltransferase involved in cell wall biosynthesis
MLANDSLDVAIINTMPFPSGYASVNRILSYSKGLVELGNKVSVYTTYYGEISWKTIDGIKYKALRKKNKNSIINKVSLPMALWRIIKLLSSPKNTHQFLILVSNSLLLIYPLKFICKLKKIKFIQEKSEFPFVLKSKSIFGKLYAKFYISTTYKLFDGIIIMTYALQDYLKQYVSKKCKLIVIPMTVDADRFENLPLVDNSLGEYIAYCGDIGGNKDGVKNLITAFHYIEKDYPQLKLLLIGGTKDPNEKKVLEKYVNEINSKNICFYGQVGRDEIPLLLCNAKILALARPSGLQSTGGFPTKLGEYLATGKPTIVTKVGDIPLYLKDGVNAFLVEPDKNKAFAEKMKYILNNYSEALTIAQFP